MARLNIYFLILLFCSNFLVGFLYGQAPFDIYKSKISHVPDIYNGGEYVPYPNSFIGHPFYETNEFNFSNIKFNGIEYNSISVLYDIERQYLVALNPTHAKQVIIPPNKTNEFILLFKNQKVKFVNINSLIEDGNEGSMFLEEVVFGYLYVLHRKNRQREIKDLERNTRFDSYESYFLLKENGLIQLQGKNAPFKNLNINKSMVKKNLKDNGLKYRKSKKSYYKAIIEIFQNSLADE
ncbi:hypothetical protein MM239_09965 [Belliella sp. DSM 111904]|uniref:DUF4105 domain-containing protein n=1 Tax=Belliella filtrata TaxID=2923435 RepID=A0ABS9V128_9BACT|nr:hypothetical protein [Belliella filtrata]MCH7409720.1 hypothetical protein [Belliella filtrata]